MHRPHRARLSGEGSCSHLVTTPCGISIARLETAGRRVDEQVLDSGLGCCTVGRCRHFLSVVLRLHRPREDSLKVAQILVVKLTAAARAA